METILLVLTLTLDAFVTSIAYGANKIKIPFLSLIIINIVCGIFLGSAIFLGSQIRKLLPGNIAVIVSFFILLFLGIYYLFEGIVKSYLERNLSLNKTLKVKLFNIQFMISIYTDGTRADSNHSKVLESKEALYLGTALSLDSLAVGFGSSLIHINYLCVVGFSFIAGVFSMIIGIFIGRKVVDIMEINLSWISGLLLIILAILKVI